MSFNADAAEAQFLINMRHLCNYAVKNFKKENVEKYFRSQLASHSPPQKDLMPMISKGILTMVKDVKEMHSDLGLKLSSVKNELSNLIKIEAKDVTRIQRDSHDRLENQLFIIEDLLHEFISKSA